LNKFQGLREDITDEKKNGFKITSQADPDIEK
jgi:hypothetical protein